MSEMSNNEPTGRDLDAALERSLGWTNWGLVQRVGDDEPYVVVQHESFDDTPQYSKRIDAMKAVEAEIELRGLQKRYAEALVVVIFGEGVVGIRNPAIELSAWGTLDGWSFVFAVAHATAEQRARAALAALSVEAGT